MRNLFAQALIKPICLQLCIDIPEIQSQREFLECVQMHWKSNNLFEELMEIELMQKRVEHIQTMKESMVDMDVEGNEIKYFSSKFLVQKYLKFSDADIRLNEKYKQEEIEELHLAGGENSDRDAGGFESLDIDDLSNMIIEAKKALEKKKAKIKHKETKDKDSDEEMKKDEEE